MSKKVIKSSGFIDSRIYDDVCLLGKILCELSDKLTDEERTVLLNRFKKHED